MGTTSMNISLQPFQNFMQTSWKYHAFTDGISQNPSFCNSVYFSFLYFPVISPMYHLAEYMTFSSMLVLKQYSWSWCLFKSIFSIIIWKAHCFWYIEMASPDTIIIYNELFHHSNREIWTQPFPSPALCIGTTTEGSEISSWFMPFYFNTMESQMFSFFQLFN